MIIKLIITLFIVVTFCPVQAEKTPTSLQKEVEKTLKLLQHPYDYMRESAVTTLVSLGPAVSPYLAQKYSKSNYLARRKMVEVWQRIGDKKSIEYIFQAINDPDDGVRMNAAVALLELSDSNKTIIDQLRQIKPNSKQEQNTIHEIITTLSFKEIEDELAKLVTPDGGYSYSSEQYDSINKLGSRAIRPLLSIFTEDNYQFIHYKFSQNTSLAQKVRILAGCALAEMQEHISKMERVIVMDRLHKTSVHKDPQIRREVACILKKFDDSAYWKQIVDHDKQYIQENPTDIDFPYHLAMMFFRVGRNYQAMEYLEYTILVNPDDSVAHFRLACVHAKRNDFEKCCMALEKAYEVGFRDYLWLKNEPDLKNVRNYPSFLVLSQKMEQAYLQYLSESKKYQKN